MTEKPKPLPDVMTLGDCYHPAMKCQTQEEADAWFEALVERDIRVHGLSREKAEAQERSNIGYFSGYYDNETAQRVFRLFRCAHPIFGTARPTADEALNMGKQLGERKVRA